ncbi:hypothetical protein CK203_008143 [Vitis vinifera]|uniref:Integrase catalytic domain-containing protein n=1 Tax=Vitis vinifera TaxID=29760 RepID=A0A438KNX3_VITVI|nr:hypothetical protein CK203_008143 [Vitis vinifera]
MLRQNHDVFAWAHSNMIGIHPSVASHRLNILPLSRHVREIEYPDWLANVVVVPKKERKWRYNMKLNPSKCAFGVSPGKFLGFMVTQRGIKVSSDQIKAVMEAPGPRNKKELQRLTGKLVTLECAFKNIKHYLTQPPIMSSPQLGERVMTDVETRYSKIEQTALALRSAAQKLRPYFQSHPVVILTNQPLHSILHKSDLSGRMLQWAIELSEEPNKEEWWTLRVDGASRSLGSGVGLLLQSPTGEQLEQAIRSGFFALNNKAEYEAILSGLDLVLALSVSKLRIYNDFQLVTSPSITEAPTCNTIEESQEESQEWMRVITEYLRTGALPDEPKHAHKIRVQTARFALIGECLYKRSFTDPYLSQYPALGHFAQWGMDIVGPLPITAAQKKFLLVATDYFSKWVEAEAYANIKDKDVTKFIWKNIICRFGIPQAIIADNGPQFDSIAFRNFCSELKIQNLYFTPRYSQSNG